MAIILIKYQKIRKTIEKWTLNGNNLDKISKNPSKIKKVDLEWQESCQNIKKSVEP